QIGGNRPGSRGPDQAPNLAPGQNRIDARGIRRNYEPNPNRRAGMVLIFDFSLGQRGTVMDAPVDRLQTLINITAIEKIDKSAGDDAFILRAHGQVWILPLTEHA